MTEVKQQDIQKTPAHTLSLFNEMDRLFDEYVSRGWLHPSHWEWPFKREMEAPFEGKTPHVNIIDHDNEIVIKAALPGVDKKDLDINITKNSVTIRGSTSHEEKEEKNDYYRYEISSGFYSRTLALPVEVDEDKAKAKFKNGMLKLTLPKLETVKSRKVKVEVE